MGKRKRYSKNKNERQLTARPILIFHAPLLGPNRYSLSLGQRTLTELDKTYNLTEVATISANYPVRSHNKVREVLRSLPLEQKTVGGELHIYEADLAALIETLREQLVASGLITSNESQFAHTKKAPQVIRHETSRSVPNRVSQDAIEKATEAFSDPASIVRPIIETITESEAAPQSADTSSSAFVYVMSNPAQKFLKIGYSENPERRARELHDTNTALPNKIEYWLKTLDAPSLERMVHRQLAGKRVSRDREFFDVELREAVKVIRKQAERTGYIDECILAGTIDGEIPTRQEWEQHQEQIRAERQRLAEEQAHQARIKKVKAEELDRAYTAYRDQVEARRLADPSTKALESDKKFASWVGIAGGILILTGVGLPLGAVLLGVALILGYQNSQEESRLREKHRPMMRDEFEGRRNSSAGEY